MPPAKPKDSARPRLKSTTPVYRPRDRREMRGGGGPNNKKQFRPEQCDPQDDVPKENDIETSTSPDQKNPDPRYLLFPRLVDDEKLIRDENQLTN